MFNKIKHAAAGDTGVSVHGGKRVLSHGWREEHQECSWGSDSLWHRLTEWPCQVSLAFSFLLSLSRGIKFTNQLQMLWIPQSGGSAHFWVSTGLVGNFCCLFPVKFCCWRILSKKKNPAKLGSSSDKQPDWNLFFLPFGRVNISLSISHILIFLIWGDIANSSESLCHCSFPRCCSFPGTADVLCQVMA